MYSSVARFNERAMLAGSVSAGAPAITSAVSIRTARTGSLRSGARIDAAAAGSEFEEARTAARLTRGEESVIPARAAASVGESATVESMESAVARAIAG